MPQFGENPHSYAAKAIRRERIAGRIKFWFRMAVLGLLLSAAFLSWWRGE